jgi:tRNA threonylcarbamoyladenosine dehydratase
MRFSGTKQLLGADAFERVKKAHVCVIGLGGVGSWVIEALARSGVGAFSLVDLDEVCISNVNRQLQALTNTVGRSKIEVLADRIEQINPDCKVNLIKSFFTKATANKVLSKEYDLVIDAIDRVENKIELILECVARGLPMITVGSGGDRVNPLTTTVSDLAFTVYDPLLQCVRKQLRHKHGFPRGERKRFHIPCVYAPMQRGPRDKTCEVTGKKVRKSCNDGLGSAVFMTGTLGFVAAAEAVKIISKERADKVYPWALKKS